MPQDDVQAERRGAASGPAQAHTQRDWRDIFRLPAPVKRVFEKFPLLSYAANELPLRSPRHRNTHTLYLFTTPEGTHNGSPSFNPTCLKWQVHLLSCGVDFNTAVSNNHASPSGALPFLLPSSTSSPTDAPAPIATNKIRKWAKEHGSPAEDSKDLRAEAYASLLDHRVRRAWLYMLYLQPDNYAAVAHKLYVEQVSSNPLVRLAVSRQLRQAAETELLKHSPHTSAQDLMQDAKDALAALSTLLGSGDYFFGAAKPALFDASVFAYTHLLLDDGLGWKTNELGNALSTFENLVEHRERILKLYF